MESSAASPHPAKVKSPPATALVDAACARLKAAGLRVTHPRRAILAALLQRGEPASIEQIHAALGTFACDLVTTYRSLAAFAEIGLVRRSFFQDGICRYHLDPGPAARFHIACPKSGQIGTLDENAAAELARALQAAEESLRSRGYTGISHRVEFFGTAPAGQAGP